MVDMQRQLKKLADLPWKSIFSAVGVSFLLASITATVVSFVILEKNVGKRPSRKAPLIADGETLSVDAARATLDAGSLDRIYQRNIFNSEGPAVEENADEAELEQRVLNPDELTKSELPLELLGTIFSGDPFNGIAMVRNTKKNVTNSFLVNDALEAGVVVIEIHRERVILDNKGRKEFIEVNQEELVRSKRSKGRSGFGAVSVVGGSNMPPPLATEPPPKTYKEEGFERNDTDITMSESYRQRLLTSDFTKVLQDAKATPNLVDGQLQGFRLTRIRKDSIYEKSGLQNDDIVKEINGVPLTDTSQAIRLLNSLRGEREFEVRVNRHGRPMNITISIQQ